MMQFEIGSRRFSVDRRPTHDISIHPGPGSQLAAFDLPAANFNPICRVIEGASVNCDQLGNYCVHSSGTHTESIGHINAEATPISQIIPRIPVLMVAQLITVSPVRLDSAVDASTIHAPHASSDLVITKQSIEQVRRQPHLAHPLSAHIEALIVRTLPNDRQQKTAGNHSGTNPPYFHQEAAEYIGGLVRHLLTDLPSVDREQDGGKLLAHRALLLRDSEPRTITEFCYVKDHVPDGVYMLNLQIMPFESDAAPARPVLHEIQWN